LRNSLPFDCLDAGLIHGFRDDLSNEKSKDGTLERAFS
jgi:hypothetical protein